MTVEERIKALVLRWLKATQGIEAVSARIDEDDWEMKSGWSGGCDTCGWETEYLQLTVWYALEGETGHQHYIEVEMNPLTFLAELIRLEDSTT